MRGSGRIPSRQLRSVQAVHPPDASHPALGPGPQSLGLHAQVQQVAPHTRPARGELELPRTAVPPPRCASDRSAIAPRLLSGSPTASSAGCHPARPARGPSSASRRHTPPRPSTAAPQSPPRTAPASARALASAPGPPAVRKSPYAVPPPPAAAGSRALPLGACGRSPERADRFESTPCQADRRPFRRSEMADLACGRASRRVPDSFYRRRPRDRRLLPQAPRYSPPHRDAARRPVEQPQHPPPVRAQLDLAVVARFGPARFVLPPAARAAARSLLALPLLPFFPNPCSSARLVRWRVAPTLLSPPRQSNSLAACILFDGNPRVHRFGDDFISSLLQLRSGQPRCPSALAPCRWASAIRLLGFVYPAPARNGPACRKNLHNRQRL